MFEQARPVALACAVGYVLAGFGAALALGRAGWGGSRDTFQQIPNWHRLLTQHAHQAAAFAFVHLLIFGLAVIGLFFWLGVAGRARRGQHPTSATLGAVFFSAAWLVVGAAAVWNGMVVPYAALLHRTTPDPAFQQALFAQIVAATFVLTFGLWCFVLFGAVGLYFLGRSLRDVRDWPRPERGWLPDVLKLAAAFWLLHVPVRLYLARESLLNNNYIRWLAVTNELLLWGGMAVATYFAATYLRTEAIHLYATAHLSKN